MKRQTKLTTEQQTQPAAEHQTQQVAGHEFATAEEMLRHDAIHTPMPPDIERRLQKSAANLPPPPNRSWWKRLLGGSNS